MLDGKLDIVTIIAIVVLIVAVLRFRSILGQRTTDDEERIDRKLRAKQEAEAQRQRAEAAGKVVTLPQRQAAADGSPPPPAVPAATADVEARYQSVAGGNVAIRNGLIAINKTDPTFDPDHFMAGAKQAYEMIVMAFAEGNRRILKDLLSPDVFERFAGAIADREGRSEQMDQSFVGINKAEIMEAEIRQGTAEITVKFVSQLISAVRDRSGKIVSGDPQRITDVTDVWTFARDLRSRNPNWRLIATQSAE
jgi:predicted lipid-binding transport protein (Tim44 family)